MIIEVFYSDGETSVMRQESFVDLRTWLEDQGFGAITIDSIMKDLEEFSCAETYGVNVTYLRLMKLEDLRKKIADLQKIVNEES